MAEHPASRRADQRRETSEQDIPEYRSAQNIRQQTAHEQPRHRRRREDRQNRQRFRDPDVNSGLSERNRREHHRQNDVDGRNDSGLGEKQNLFVFHKKSLRGFVLREDGFKLTGAA